jgi:dynein heavy chain
MLRLIPLQVSNQDNTAFSGETGGPIEEIEFWSSRTQDLSGISQQLNAPGLLAIVGVLREAGSSYLGPFEMLAKNIQRGSDEANDNLKFLTILRPHCEALVTAHVRDIPAILPDILSRIRVIGAVSRYYHAEERLTGLLRKISNEVIRRCIAHINIYDIFDGDLLSVMGVLKECLNTCTEWRKCYNETVEAVAANPGARGLVWNFDVMSIFAQVEAFVQRCRDLIEVCEGQIQFARKSGVGGAKTPLPAFGGARGPDISRSLQTIDDSFQGYLGILREISHELLDVKAVRWHDANNAFKNGMKELEVMMSNVINDAFHGVTSIPMAVDLLEAFSSLAKRPAVQRAVDKKAVDVFTLFLKQVSFLG